MIVHEPRSLLPFLPRPSPQIPPRDRAELPVRRSVQKKSDGLEEKTLPVWPAPGRRCHVTDEGPDELFKGCAQVSLFQTIQRLNGPGNVIGSWGEDLLGMFQVGLPGMPWEEGWLESLLASSQTIMGRVEIVVLNAKF